MKYLFINGSPHKGNTWKLAELVKEDLKIVDKDPIFKEIHLAEENLPFCCGCSNCFRLGYEKCPHYSILQNILQEIDRADGVIFTSTTYNLRETSLLKNLFDHLCFMLHRPYFFKSKALILTTTGGIGAKSTTKSISSMLKGIGFNRCYQFGCSSFSWNDYSPSQKTKTALTNLSNRFFKDLLSKKLHSPSCKLLIPYNLFRGMALSYVKGTPYETQDGIHWTEECRKYHVYDSCVKVPFYKKPIGQLFYMIGKIVGRKTLITYKKRSKSLE